MRRRTPRVTNLRTALLTLVFLAASSLGVVPRVAAYSLLVNRYDKLDTSIAGATATHEFGFQMANTATPIGSITFEFCSNSPILNDVCTVPSGFDASGAVLSQQSGDTGFSIDPASTANYIILTRTASNPAGVSSVYRFTNIINPNTAGSYYVRLRTHTAIDGTGLDIENGGVVFAMTSSLNINTEVPPYLRFCAGVTIVSFDCSSATSFFVDLGELHTNSASKATSQFLVATNAQSGYSVFISGTTMTSGNNTIPAMGGTGSQTGTSQFGINLRANSNPAVGTDVVGPGSSTPTGGYNTPNSYKFQNGDTLVTVPFGNDNRKYTVSYVVNVSSSQPAGVYATTMSYICLANF